MKPLGIKVFISYRRQTGRDVARNIYERLSLKGINTFFDYNSMRNGKFNDQIYEAIEQATDFILILSKNALNNCVYPEDWVRIEIEHALKFKKNIIIVSTEPEIAFPDNLPESLGDLPLYHGMTLNQEYYEEGIARLMKMLSNHNPATDKKRWQLNNKIKNKDIKFLLLVMSGVLGGICLVFFFLKLSSTDERQQQNKGLLVKVYLPRYADLDREILNITWFSDYHKNYFEYIDTIINGQYWILPISQYFTNNIQKKLSVISKGKPFYHNLPLRLSIRNTKSQTYVIKKAELEVIAIYPLSSPIISILDSGKSLKFISQSSEYSPNYTIYYSFLTSLESHTTYKNIVEVNKGDFSLGFEDKDQIQGKIIKDNNQWIFNYIKNTGDGITNNDSLDNKNIAKIEPASSNVKIFEVMINSLDAPRYYSMNNMRRKIVNGEIDDDLYIIIKSKMCFQAKLRVILFTSTNTKIITDPINVIYVKPMTYENYPF